MHPYLVFLWRDQIVFRQHMPEYILYGVFQPLLLLYGMAAAFRIQGMEITNYLIPGFLVYTATASTFMGSAYGLYDHITTQRTSCWYAAAVRLDTILLSNALCRMLRASIGVVTMFLASFFLLKDGTPHHVFAVAAILALIAFIAALWGSVVATWADRIDQIYLSDILVYIVFVLSGIFVDIAAFPKVIQYLAWLLPTWHAVELVRPLYMDQPLAWGQAALHMAALSGQGLLTYELSLRMLKHRVLN